MHHRHCAQREQRQLVAKAHGETVRQHVQRHWLVGSHAGELPDRDREAPHHDLRRAGEPRAHGSQSNCPANQLRASTKGDRAVAPRWFHPTDMLSCTLGLVNGDFVSFDGFLARMGRHLSRTRRCELGRRPTAVGLRHPGEGWKPPSSAIRLVAGAARAGTSLPDRRAVLIRRSRAGGRRAPASVSNSTFRLSHTEHVVAPPGWVLRRRPVPSCVRVEPRQSGGNGGLPSRRLAR